MPPFILPAGKVVEVFFDGDCPLCTREIRMLRRKDHAGRILFTDLAAPHFDASLYGRTHAELMARIAARLPDGTWLDGVEVFRALYAAIGWRRAVALSRLPGLSHLLEAAYSLFARNRLRLTGRCDGARACETAPPTSR